MVGNRSPSRDTSEDSVLLLPRHSKSQENMAGSEENKNDLRLSQRIAYGLGHVLNDICSAMWFSYTLLFFEVVLRMPSSLAGTLICVGQIADGIASPVVGILIDRQGTRKSWHMLGTTLIGFSYSLIFSNAPWLSDHHETSSSNSTQSLDSSTNSWDNLGSTDVILGTLYYAVLVSVFQAGWAMVQIAHLAIIPDITPNKNERANLTAIRYTATVCASVFVYLITWFVLHVTDADKSGLGPKDAYKFKDIVLLGLLVGVICTLLFHAILDTPNTVQQKTQTRKSLSAWCGIIRGYFKSFLLYQVTFLYFASRMLLNISLIYMPLYLVEKVGKNAEYIAIVPLVSYLASFAASLFVRQFRKYFCSKTNYLIGAVLSIIACVWIGMNFESTLHLFGISILLGAGSSITSVSSLCLCADLIGTDTENGAFVYSIVTAVDKLLGGIIVIVIEYFKTDSSVQSTHYYQDILAYGCGIFSVLGLFFLLTMYCNKNSAKVKLSEDCEETAKN